MEAFLLPALRMLCCSSKMHLGDSRYPIQSGTVLSRPQQRHSLQPETLSEQRTFIDFPIFQCPGKLNSQNNSTFCQETCRVFSLAQNSCNLLFCKMKDCSINTWAQFISLSSFRHIQQRNGKGEQKWPCSSFTITFPPL